MIMAIEIEAKMKVVDLETIRRALRARGGTRYGSELETNAFFDTSSAGLKAAGKGLRLRTAVDEFGKARYAVTSKGPLLPGDLKSREEIEFTVDDPVAATALFENLGFGQTISFEKRRESWRLLDCKVELDEMPYLGTFVEIEGPGEEKVMSARKALGLSNEPMIKTAYVALLIDHLKKIGEANRVVKF
jgi:adenylate cyclase class 2